MPNPVQQAHETIETYRVAWFGDNFAGRVAVVTLGWIIAQGVANLSEDVYRRYVFDSSRLSALRPRR